MRCCSLSRAPTEYLQNNRVQHDAEALSENQQDHLLRFKSSLILVKEKNDANL